MKAITALIILTGLAVAGRSSGHPHRSLTMEELVGESDRIVIGSIRDMHAQVETVTIDSSTGRQGKIPFTYFTLVPSEALKGVGGTAPVTMRMIGGSFDGYAVVTADQPRLHTGERVLFFMRELAIGTSEPVYQIEGGKVGKFGIRTENGADVVYRDRVPNADLNAAGVPETGAIPLSVLRSLVATAVGNQPTESTE